MTGNIQKTPAGVPEVFYASKKWRDFRILEITKRGLRCEACKKIIHKIGDACLHHIIHLNGDNWQDASIALNPANVTLLCRGCHNKEHPERGEVAFKEKEVYIVYGMPLSGKTSLVNERKGRYDIVLDMDSLYEAITHLPRYDKPDGLYQVVRAVYNELIDKVKTRTGRWRKAWVIGGFADKYQREKLASDLGAKLIYMECTREEAISRLMDCPERRDMQENYIGYIDTWIRKYTE